MCPTGQSNLYNIQELILSFASDTHIYHPVDAKHAPMLAHLQPTVSQQCLRY